MIKNVFLVTNTSCNQSCSYCFYNTGLLRNIEGFLDLNDLRNFLNKTVERISITGGEPLVNPYLLDYVNIATSISNNVALSTNGKLLTRQLIRKLKRLGIRKIFISLDDLSRNIDKKYRGSTRSHTLRVINNALEAKLKIEISSVITTENINYIFDIQEFCKKNNINFWPSPIFCSKKNNLSLSNIEEKEWRKILDKIPIKHQNTKASKFLWGYYKIFVKKDTIKRCPLEKQLVINTNGDIKRCFFNKSIGNIKNLKLSKIKSSKNNDISCFGEQCFQYLI